MTHPIDDEPTGGWRDIERRRNNDGNGWTMGREIVGTIIGMLAVCIPLGIALVTWGTHVESALSTHAISIDYIHQQTIHQEQMANASDSRVDQRLIRIEAKIDDLGRHK